MCLVDCELFPGRICSIQILSRHGAYVIVLSTDPDCGTGQIGFGKDMGGLAAVRADKNVETDEAATLLAGSHEIADQMKDPLRWVKLWRPDVLHGAYILWKFKVTQHDVPTGPASFCSCTCALAAALV